MDCGATWISRTKRSNARLVEWHSAAATATNLLWDDMHLRPEGAALYNYYAHGELKSHGSSITEGIGQGRVTKNLEGLPIDTAYQITDEEALPVLFDLIEHEGLVLGGSTAINIVGAMRLARELGPGKTIVTILCDGGSRYQSKLFNPASGFTSVI